MRTLLVGLLLLALPAAAAEEKTPSSEKAEDAARTVPGGASKGVKACHEDIERFCKDVIAGEGRLGACLKANRKKLSKKCLKWAAHGGKAHTDEALTDIDKAAPKTK